MAVARLMGLELRDYQKDGKDMVFCTLHLCHVEGTVKSVKGSKCESCTCPRDLDPYSLKVGALYELVYEIYDFKGETRARLQDLKLVDEPDMGGKKQVS